MEIQPEPVANVTYIRKRLRLGYGLVFKMNISAFHCSFQLASLA